MNKTTAAGWLLVTGIGGAIAYNAYNAPIASPKMAVDILPLYEQTAAAAGRQLAYQQGVTTAQAASASTLASATRQAIENQSKQLTLAERGLQLTQTALEIENQRLQAELGRQLTASAANAQANATATMQAVMLTQTAVPLQTQQAIEQQRVVMQLAAEQQTLSLRTWSPWVLSSVGCVIVGVVLWRVRHNVQSYIGQFADVLLGKLKLVKRQAGVDLLTVESGNGQTSVASTAKSVAAGMTVQAAGVQFHESGAAQPFVTAQQQAIEFVQAGGRRKNVVHRPALQALPDDAPPTLIQSATTPSALLPVDPVITTATPDAYTWLAELEQ